MARRSRYYYHFGQNLADEDIGRGTIKTHYQLMRVADTFYPLTSGQRHDFLQAYSTKVRKATGSPVRGNPGRERSLSSQIARAAKWIKVKAVRVLRDNKGRATAVQCKVVKHGAHNPKRIRSGVVYWLEQGRTHKHLAEFRSGDQASKAALQLYMQTGRPVRVMKKDYYVGSPGWLWFEAAGGAPSFI